jgi:hypothetical protein
VPSYYIAISSCPPSSAVERAVNSSESCETYTFSESGTVCNKNGGPLCLHLHHVQVITGPHSSVGSEVKCGTVLPKPQKVVTAARKTQKFTYLFKESKFISEWALILIISVLDNAWW